MITVIMEMISMNEVLPSHRPSRSPLSAVRVLTYKTYIISGSYIIGGRAARSLRGKLNQSRASVQSAGRIKSKVAT